MLYACSSRYEWSNSRIFVVLIALMVAIPFGACSESGGPDGAMCIPGETRQCLCVGGGAGVQACADTGSRFEPCDCSTEPEDDLGGLSDISVVLNDQGSETTQPKDNCYMLRGRLICLQKKDSGYDPKSEGVTTVALPAGGLPESASLDTSGYDNPDQGICGSCVAFATHNAMAIMAHGSGSSIVDFSPPHIWYVAGYGSVDCPEGSTIVSVVKAQSTSKTYIVPSTTWAYDSSSPDESLEAVPNQKVLDDDGIAYLATWDGVSPNSIRDMKASIAQGYLAVVAVEVYVGFYDDGRVKPTNWASTDGAVGTPDYGDERQGSHAVVLVGYDDYTEVFTFINSWGDGFPENGTGFGTLSYGFMEKYCTGGMALKSLKFRDSCATDDFCYKNNFTSGKHCNGSGSGSQLVTCAKVQNCPVEAGIEVCAAGCTSNQCVACECSGLICCDGCNFADIGTKCSECQTCNSTGQCNQSRPDGTLCANGKCQGGICGDCIPNNHKECSAGTLYWYDSCDVKGTRADSCDDLNSCTTDGCPGSSCTHSNVANGTNCGSSKVCQDGQCVQPNCSGKCAGASNGIGGTCATNDCDGCCSGTTCNGETSDSSCGIAGGSCTNCTLSGKTCSSGTCTTICVPNCTEKCAGASNDCGGTCPSNSCNGCCSNKVCEDGTSDSLCGTNGSSCVNCSSSSKTCRSQSCQSSGPVVTKILPLTAPYNVATTFTVTGTDLPSTLVAWIPGCADLTYGSRGATKATFTCTPKWAGSGAMDSVIKTASGGSTIYEFVVNVTCSSPVIVDVSPLTTTRNKVTSFAAAGACIPGTAVAWIGNCGELAYTERTESDIKWTCKASATAGTFDGVIKTQNGGTTLKSFSVVVN